MSRPAPVLVDHTGAPLPPSVQSGPRGPVATAPGGAPYIPDGTSNFGFYDALNYNTNRSARPFFSTDSKFTLTQWSQLRAMALARWGYINVPQLKGAVDLNARLTMGTGFSPKSHCADKGLAKAYDEYYAEKTAHIGFMGGESMDDLLIHDSRCSDVDGDLGYVMVEDEYGNPRLQLIEAHRIRNGDVTDPACRDGVWVDNYARKTHYNVILPGETAKTAKIPVQNFIYLAEHNRPDEVRSMTNLIHALAPIQDLYEIIGFTMGSAKKNAEIGTVIETNTPHDLPLSPQVEMIFRQAQAASDGGAGLAAQNVTGANLHQPGVPQQRVTYEQIYGGGGKIVVTRPGESVKSWNHTQPSPTIEAWAEFIIRGVAVGFGLPFEILWNPENIGGANTRMIVALVKMRIAQRRNLLVYPKLIRTRFWILSKGIKRGELKYSPDIFHVSWQPNFSDPTVDAGREERESRANVQAGLETFTAHAAENGRDYLAQQLPSRAAEVDAQCAEAEKLCARYKGLSFSDALARIAMLTPNGNEVSGKSAEPDPKNKKSTRM